MTDSPHKPPEFTAERNAALLSLDEAQILAMCRRWEVDLGTGEALWVGVHKARTAIPTLPLEARQESHRWLTERGFASFLPLKLRTKEERRAAATVCPACGGRRRILMLCPGGGTTSRPCAVCA